MGRQTPGWVKFYYQLGRPDPILPNGHDAIHHTNAGSYVRLFAQSAMRF